MANFWQTLPKPFTALAPMAGVTDVVFRNLCKQQGADVVYTEFVCVDAVAHDSKKTFSMMKFNPDEQPVVVQLFGKNPSLFKQSASIIESLGFSGIDINFGCPAYKVVRHGGGVSLMRQPSRCRELIESTLAGTKLPVSIKIRASINKKTSETEIDKEMNKEWDSCNNTGIVTALDLLEEVKDLPISAVMLHARSYEQPFDGVPDWNIVKEAKKLFKGVLMANGGITSPEIAKEVLEITGADGLGIARGAWGRPWLFKQIKDYLKTGTYHEPSWEEIKQVMVRHAELALRDKGEHGMLELRKHLGWYVKGMENAKEMRKELVTVNNVEDVRKILERW
ncbi:MAG: tRNA-dihydrouridine synthase [bacterium]